MEWYHALLVGFALLILAAILEWLFEKIADIREEKKQAQTERTLPDISEAEKIQQLRYTGLESVTGFPSRLFYSADGKKRILFYARKNNVLVIQERLDLYSGEEINFACCYGFWAQINDYFVHLYDSEETALKEWKRELSSYREEAVPVPTQL